MRQYGKIWRSLLLAGFLAAGGAAAAAEYASVPSSLGQIPDRVFREALGYYAPQYDALARGDQVTAYVNIYKVLNNGQYPSLSPGDAGMMQASRQASAAPQRSARRSGWDTYTGMNYDPWADPSFDPRKEWFAALGGW